MDSARSTGTNIMSSSRFLQLGWVFFAATIILVLAGGFQGAAEKTGVADITRIVDQSDFGKSVKEQYTTMRQARESVLEFIDTNRVLTFEQATRLRDLSLKPTQSAEEKAELDSLKANVVAANKKWTELATKANMTPEERTLVQEYADRAQKMNDLGQRWVREFTADMDSWMEKQKLTSIERARASIQDVAKAQGYTVVLESSIAPYGANDITDAALASMNAKK